MHFMELKEKIIAYRILQSRLESLVRNINLIEERIRDLENVIGCIEALDDKEAVFSLGSEVYVKGKVIEKNEFFVDIGSDIIVKMNKEKVREFLNEKMEIFKKNYESLKKEIKNINEKLSKMEPEIRKILERSEE